MTAHKPIIKAQAFEFRSRASTQQMFKIDQAIEAAARNGEFSCMYVLPSDAGEIMYEMIKENLEKRRFKFKLKYKPGSYWWGGYTHYRFEICW